MWFGADQRARGLRDAAPAPIRGAPPFTRGAAEAPTKDRHRNVSVARRFTPASNQMREIFDRAHRLQLGHREFRVFDLLEIEGEENEIERVEPQVSPKIVTFMNRVQGHIETQ
jgi:hypothetical protein